MDWRIYLVFPLSFSASAKSCLSMSCCQAARSFPKDMNGPTILASIHEIRVVFQRPILSQLPLFRLFLSLDAGPVASILSNLICVTNETVFHLSYSHVIRTDCRPSSHLSKKKKDIV